MILTPGRFVKYIVFLIANDRDEADKYGSSQYSVGTCGMVAAYYRLNQDSWGGRDLHDEKTMPAYLS